MMLVSVTLDRFQMSHSYNSRRFTSRTPNSLGGASFIAAQLYLSILFRRKSFSAVILWIGPPVWNLA